MRKRSNLKIPRSLRGILLRLSNNKNGGGREDYLIRLCMVVDWCIDHPEYTAKIKVIPKKDYPILMLCEGELRK